MKPVLNCFHDFSMCCRSAMSRISLNTIEVKVTNERGLISMLLSMFYSNCCCCWVLLFCLHYNNYNNEIITHAGPCNGFMSQQGLYCNMFICCLSVCSGLPIRTPVYLYRLCKNIEVVRLNKIL